MKQIAIIVVFLMFAVSGIYATYSGPRYTDARPFNWYYPNNYRYYYPQLKLYGYSCYLTYVNGTFVYTCH